MRIQYALNGILSDLIAFGAREIEGEEVGEFNSEIPVVVSHIFVFLPKLDIHITDIEVYEQTEQYESEFYPAYRDIDLKDNYYLDTVSVYTDEKGYFYYTVYASMDGRDFQLLARKTSNDSCSYQQGCLSGKWQRSKIYSCLHRI